MLKPRLDSLTVLAGPGAVIGCQSGADLASPTVVLTDARMDEACGDPAWRGSACDASPMRPATLDRGQREDV